MARKEKKGEFKDIFKEPKKKKKRTDAEIIADGGIPKGSSTFGDWWEALFGNVGEDIDSVYKDREGMFPDLPKTPSIPKLGKDIIPLALVGLLLFFVIRD